MIKYALRFAHARGSARRCNIPGATGWQTRHSMGQKPSRVSYRCYRSMVNSNLDQIHRADPRRIVQKHDPSYLPLVEKIGIHALIDNEQEALREIIASELTIVGLDFDGEPTQG